MGVERPPGVSVRRWRRFLLSTSSTRSPGLQRPAHGRISVFEARAPKATEGATSPVVGAHTRGSARARRARPRPRRRSARAGAFVKARDEHRLRARRLLLQPIQHVLVAEVPVALGHRALLDDVVDAAHYAIGRHLALTDAHERLHLLDETVARRQHGYWRERYVASQRNTLPRSTAASSSRLWPVTTTS